MKRLIPGILFMLLLTIPLAAQSQDEEKTVGYELTAGRAKSMVGMAAGLISAVAGWYAFSDSRKSTYKKKNNTPLFVAALGGLLGLTLGCVHVASTLGGIGTGGGKAGGILSVALGSAGLLFASLTYVQHRKKKPVN